MPGDEFDLLSRGALPPHLRVLAEKYPRGTWQGHRNFGGLTRFWLDRHGMFREVQRRLGAEAEVFLDGGAEAKGYGQRLYRLGSLFINELHGHHHIEDAHYFPMLSAKAPEIAAAFELLDRDHHAMEELLEELTGATNGALQVLAGAAGGGAKTRDAVGAFHRSIVAFEAFLGRHLADEEEIVVPVILEHGEAGIG